MKFKLISALALSFLGLSLFAGNNSNQKLPQFKKELGIESLSSKQENPCHLYIVHHGDTDYTVEKRLQGWVDIPLNEKGKQQMKELSQKLSQIKVDAIYTSSLSRAVESAKILQTRLHCPVYSDPALRGESHGKLEGLKKEEYKKDPYYIQYKSLSPEEQLFVPVGEEGISKADVVRCALPAIQEICKNHRNQNVVIVTHGGLLKFLNFLLTNDQELNEVPHGEVLRIDGDGTQLSLGQ